MGLMTEFDQGRGGSAMTCSEERMRRGLAELAGGVKPRVDSSDLAAEIVRSVRRRRAAIGLLVAVAGVWLVVSVVI